MVTTLAPTQQSVSPVPSKVFPLPGWTGPINSHWGVAGNNGGSDLMVSASGVQPVVSMVSGKVTFVSSQASAPTSGGNAIEIHGIDGLDYYYAHLADAIGLKPGDTVAAGQLLGTADTTGDAAGGPPHLHIGIGYGIQTGTTATGGLGKGFDAVAALKALVNNPSANNPQIVSSDTQSSITTSQPAGTIQLGAAPAPVTQSLADRIRWLAGLLANAGVPGSSIPVLTAISLAENGSSNPTAVSSTNDVGLWQINIPTWAQALIQAGVITSVTDLNDPIKNAQAAAYVLAHQGLTAWSTFNQGLQNQYLAPVQAALTGYTLPGAGSTPSGGGTGTPSGPNPCNCGTWLHTPFGDIPDLGCVLQCQIGNIIEQWKTNWLNWWNSWTKANAANWLFVIGGAILTFIGVAMLASGNKQAQAAVGAIAAA